MIHQAPAHSRRNKNNTWTRSEGRATGTATPRSNVWTRPDAFATSSGSAAVLRRQPAAQHDNAGSESGVQPAQQPLRRVNGCEANERLREAGFGQSGACPLADSSARQAERQLPQQYIKKRPNQLVRAESDVQAPTVPRLAPVRTSHGKAVQPASIRQQTGQQTAAASASAAPSGSSSWRRPATAVAPSAAAASRQMQLPQRPAAVPSAAAPSRQAQQPQLAAAKASKRWVHPAESESAVDRLAEAHTLQTPTAGKRSRGAAAVPAQPSPVTPSSVYRPRLPAWAHDGRARSRKALVGGVRPRRRSSVMRLQRHLGRAAHTWQRLAASPTTAAAAAATTAPQHRLAAAGSSLRTDMQAAAPQVSNGPHAPALSWLELGAATKPASQTAADSLQRSQTSAAAAASGTAASAGGSASAAGVRSSRASDAAAKCGTAKRHTKLQRIGGHLYSTGGGKSRSLQRQVATPTAATAAAAAAATPSSKQVRKAKMSLLYPGKGKHRRVLVRRLSTATVSGSPRGLMGSASLRRRQLRSSNFSIRRSALGSSSSSSSSRKRKHSVSGRKGREKDSKRQRLLPQIYCTEYCRTGQCKQRQSCKYVHHSSKVAVCNKWLQGRCTDAECPLQHALRPELMPVCSFFLKGACGKADCPYLHVNLEAGAPVCEAFLRGWCPAGAACRQQHLTPKMVHALRQERKLRAGGGGRDAVTVQAKSKGRKRQRYFMTDNDEEEEMEEVQVPEAAAVAAEAVDHADSVSNSSGSDSDSSGSEAEGSSDMETASDSDEEQPQDQQRDVPVWPDFMRLTSDDA